MLDSSPSVLGVLLRPVSFCISSSPSGLVSPDCTPRPWHWQHGLLPLISVMEGQEMTVPRSSVDEMMEKPKFKSFFLTYSFILLLDTHHPNRHHFKAVFKALLEFLMGFWLPSGKQGTFSFHGHFQAWERDLVAQISLSFARLALTSHLPKNLVCLRHPAQVRLQPHPAQPHPGFQWLHRPGFGLLSPLWAFDPHLSLLSDFTSPPVVDS